MLQLKELKERQKQQLRHKALKKGLDPEALTGKYPVSISKHTKRYYITEHAKLKLLRTTRKLFIDQCIQVEKVNIFLAQISKRR